MGYRWWPNKKILRPDSQSSNSNWSNQDAQTLELWQDVDEVTPDDSDYIESGGGATITFGLSAVTDPGVDTGHILRVRSWKDTGVTGDIDVELRDSNFGLIESFTVTSTGNQTWVTDEFAVDSTNAANITDYSLLSVTVIGNTPIGTKRVSWIEMEVP